MVDIISRKDGPRREDAAARIFELDTETSWAQASGDALAAELSTYLRGSLSGVKMPRQIDFRDELPRHATGKLYKRLLRDQYWDKAKAEA